MASAVPVALTGADQVVASTGPVTYQGVTLRETAGAVAKVQVWDNATTNSGTLLDTVALAANESKSLFYPEEAIRAVNGVFVKIVAGTVEGSVRIG